jgi:hypothetical protein
MAAVVRVVGGVRSIRRGKAILQPIVVCRRIVVAHAPQKRIGEHPRGGAMCVGCEVLEGGVVLGAERVVRRGHICVGLPTYAHAFFRFFPAWLCQRHGAKGAARGSRRRTCEGGS